MVDPATMLRMRLFVTRRSRRLTFVLATVMVAGVCALPSFAGAVNAAPAVREADVSVGTLARSKGVRSQQLPIRADMIGVTWTGASAGLELRTRTSSGSWSAWVAIDAGDDAPDPSSAEGRHATHLHTLATPIVAIGAQQVQVRTRGVAQVQHVMLEAINTSGTATRSSRVASGITARAAALLRRILPSASAQAPQPFIHTRASWGAQAPTGNAGIADQVYGVVVHHTVSTNMYSCASVPGLLRGIQRYHIHTNGWFDIGYNFVVDRCGGIWEARSGGITQAVIGAHTAGFNTGTVGIALLGTYTSATPSSAQRTSLERLIAWRMDIAHVLPKGSMKLIARSADKFPLGTHVTVRAVSGHRDLYPTACPGNGEYRLLKQDAARAQSIGGLKVGNVTTAPNVDPLSGELRSVVVRALSTSRSALLRIAVEQISTGAILAQTTVHTSVAKLSTGPLPTNIAAWDVRVRVTGSSGKHRARTYLQPLMHYSVDPGLVITTPPPTTIEQGQLLSAGYSLLHSARISADLYDSTTGAHVSKLPISASSATLPTGAGTLSMKVPTTIAPGTYELRIEVASDTAPGRSVKRFVLTVSAAPPTTQTF